MRAWSKQQSTKSCLNYTFYTVIFVNIDMGGKVINFPPAAECVQKNRTKSVKIEPYLVQKWVTYSSKLVKYSETFSEFWSLDKIYAKWVWLSRKIVQTWKNGQISLPVQMLGVPLKDVALFYFMTDRIWYFTEYQDNFIRIMARFRNYLSGVLHLVKNM